MGRKKTTTRTAFGVLGRPLVCSYGGGRNSCAGLVGLKRHGVIPDRIQFSDTGTENAEKPETYDHIRLMSEWCQDNGFPPITVVRVATNVNAIDKSLEAHCLRTGYLPSIAYGFKRCSQRWKADPQHSDLTRWAPAVDAWKHGKKVTRAIFYDAGEPHRAEGLLSKPDEKLAWWFPLLEWGWDLERCLAEIETEGIPKPPKSACFFCPSSRKVEVLALAHEHPDLFTRAVAMEHGARANSTAVKGLGRHWSWEEIVQADRSQLDLFPDASQIPCMCFDGDDEE